MPGAKKILVAFHSSEGQTEKIARRIAELLKTDGFDVGVFDAAAAPAPTAFDGVVLGDSIHTGRHSPELTTYLEEHAAALDAMTSALFQVSLTSANPDEEHTAVARRLVDQLLEATRFDPDLVGMFAGAVIYRQYGWVKRHLMHAIVKKEDSTTDMSRDREYTDWQSVERFTEDFAALVAAK
jgi:menaquinone-dependent protoporphyrinogen oxidase